MSEEEAIDRIRRKTAERVRRWRARQDELGNATVTVTASREAVPIIKALAKRTATGEPVAEVLRSLGVCAVEANWVQKGT